MRGSVKDPDKNGFSRTAYFVPLFYCEEVYQHRNPKKKYATKSIHSHKTSTKYRYVQRNNVPVLFRKSRSRVGSPLAVHFFKVAYLHSPKKSSSL